MSPILERRTMAAVLREAVERWPDRTFLRFGPDSLTYGELGLRANRYLGQLQALGLGRSDLVLVMLDNGLEFPAATLGAATGGVVSVPVNTEYRGQTLRHILAQSGAPVVLTSARFVERILEVRPPTLRTIVLVDGAEGLQAGDDSVVQLDLEHRGTPVGRRELDELAVMYTSGTTGPSKGGVISEMHAFKYAAKNVDMLHLTEKDVYYSPLPLFHVAGQWAAVYACLQSGSECVLTPRFSASRFWSECGETGATKTFLLGAMAQFLHRAEEGPTPEGRLERVFMAPLIDDLDAFKQRFGVSVATCYGSTEVNLPLSQDDDGDARTEYGVGWPRPGYDVRLVSTDGSGVDVADDTVGELWVRATEPGTTLVRYHDNDEATAATIVDGWLHSGDTFRRDSRGSFHFVDRLKDALRRRGENISSFEVETEVRSHPAVVECAVVGVASADTEQEVAAFVQLRPGAEVDADDIRAHVARNAPRFMVPDHVFFVDTFPQTPTGKIKKYELRDQAATSVGDKQP